jgi:hypothetical protein
MGMVEGQSFFFQEEGCYTGRSRSYDSPLQQAECWAQLLYRKKKKGVAEGVQKKVQKKKGVTRVAHAATLQLNPAMEGYSQYEKKVQEEEEGCYTGRSRSYAATEPSHGRIQPVREGEPSGQTPPEKKVQKKKGVT